MIRRILFYGGLFLGSVILQTTLFHYLKIGGVKPDLLLIIIVLSAVLKGKTSGAELGFAYGLLEDLFVGKYIGLQALTKMITGYCIGLLERKIFPDNVLVPVVVSAAGTVIHNLLLALTLILTGDFGVFTPGNFLSFTGASCFYNICIAILLYGPFYKFHTKVFSRQVKF